MLDVAEVDVDGAEQQSEPEDEPVCSTISTTTTGIHGITMLPTTSSTTPSTISSTPKLASQASVDAPGNTTAGK